jgi:hypothetical protein
VPPPPHTQQSDAPQTPKSRFAAALAAAKTPSTVQRMRFNDPTLQPGSVSKTIERLGGNKVGRVGGDLPPPRIKTFDAPPAGKGSGKKSGRKLGVKGALGSPGTGDITAVTRPTQRVQTLISPLPKAKNSDAPAPTEAARAERKRKSDEAEEAANDGDNEDDEESDVVGASEVASFAVPATAVGHSTLTSMKKDALKVTNTKQNKRRRPTKPAEMLRKRARRTEVEHTPGKYDADGAPSFADAGQPPVAPMDLDAGSEDVDQGAAAAATEPDAPNRAPTATKELLNPPSKVATAAAKSVVAPPGTRPGSLKTKRAPPAVAALKAAEKQRIMAEQKAAERKQRNAEMRAKFYAPKQAAAAAAAAATVAATAGAAGAAATTTAATTTAATTAATTAPTAVATPSAAAAVSETQASSGGKARKAAEEERAAQEQRDREVEAKKAERRAALEEKERQVRENMAARKAEIEARQKQFEEKSAKQKAAKLMRNLEQVRSLDSLHFTLRYPHDVSLCTGHSHDVSLCTGVIANSRFLYATHTTCLCAQA